MESLLGALLIKSSVATKMLVSDGWCMLTALDSLRRV